MNNWFDFIIICIAAFAAGGVNAIAGGGTLITFPVLTALGIPPIIANITNTVALCPGFLGAALTGFKDLKKMKAILFLLIPACILGALAGGFLLLNTEEKIFNSAIPFLILLASCLLAIQEFLKNWLLKKKSAFQQGLGQCNKNSTSKWLTIPLSIAAIYGGYFGAGLGVILLATLGLFLEDSLTKLNTLKQFLSFVINTTAAIFFIFSGKVNWPVALVMAVGTLAGGITGGKLIGRINPVYFKWIVVTIGVIVSIIYFFK